MECWLEDGTNGPNRINVNLDRIMNKALGGSDRGSYV